MEMNTEGALYMKWSYCAIDAIGALQLLREWLN